MLIVVEATFLCGHIKPSINNKQYGKYLNIAECNGDDDTFSPPAINGGEQYEDNKKFETAGKYPYF